MSFSLQFLIGGYLLIAVSVYHTSGQRVSANNYIRRCTSPWNQVQSNDPNGKSMCFWYSTEKASWIGAAAWCRMIGGHLVELTNPRMSSHVVRYMPQQIKGKFWIGLSDVEENGTYRWMHSKQIMSGLPYTSNLLPDLMKNCVNIDEKGLLHVEACNAQLQFVCEK